MTRVQTASRRSRGSTFAKLAFMAFAAAMLSITASRAVGIIGCGCFIVPQTIAHDIDGCDVAIIAKLVELPKKAEPNGDDASVAASTAKFEIEDTIKGIAAIKGAKIISVPFVDKKPLGTEYLVLGVKSDEAPHELAWAPAYAISPRSRKYI